MLIGVGGRPCGGSRFLWQRSAHQHWHPWYMPCTMLRHHAASESRQRPPSLFLVPILACAVPSRCPNGCALDPGGMNHLPFLSLYLAAGQATEGTEQH